MFFVFWLIAISDLFVSTKKQTSTSELSKPRVMRLRCSCSVKIMMTKQEYWPCSGKKKHPEAHKQQGRTTIIAFPKNIYTGFLLPWPWALSEFLFIRREFNIRTVLLSLQPQSNSEHFLWPDEQMCNFKLPQNLIFNLQVSNGIYFNVTLDNTVLSPSHLSVFTVGPPSAPHAPQTHKVHISLLYYQVPFWHMSLF